MRARRLVVAVVTLLVVAAPAGATVAGPAATVTDVGGVAAADSGNTVAGTNETANGPSGTNETANGTYGTIEAGNRTYVVRGSEGPGEAVSSLPSIERPAGAALPDDELPAGAVLVTDFSNRSFSGDRRTDPSTAFPGVEMVVADSLAETAGTTGRVVVSSQVDSVEVFGQPIGAGAAATAGTVEFTGPAAASYVPDESGSVTVTSEYGVLGTATQLRESSAFGNSVTRVGAQTVVRVRDTTTGDVVATASRTHYDTTTPAWGDLLNNAVFDLAAELAERALGLWFGGEEVIGLATPLEEVDTDINGREYGDNDARLSAEFDAVAGHEYVFEHETRALAVGAGLNADATAETTTAVTLDRVVVVPASSDALPTARTNVSVVLDGAPSGVRQYNVTVASDGAPVTNVSAGLPDAQSFDVYSGGVGETAVVGRAVDVSDSVGAFDGRRTLFTVTFAGNVTAVNLTLSVTELTDDDGKPVAADRVSLVVGDGEEPLFTEPLPGTGGVGPPTDANGDGVVEDVDGNGQEEFADVVAFAFLDASRLTAAQRDVLDYNDDGSVDFGDVLELAFGL
jgi:hypothetical protein